jgi:hypothetical protein
MKKITVNEFKQIIENGKWAFEQECETTSDFESRDEWYDEYSDSFVMSEIRHFAGYGTKTASFEDLKITYNEVFQYDENQPDSFTSDTSDLDVVWEFEGFSLVDIDGDDLDLNEFTSLIPSEFSCIDYSEIESKIQQTIDFDKDADMEKITISGDNAPDIRFVGEKIGSASSTDNNANQSSYSGSTGRWTELALYQSIGGKYICEQIGRTRWTNERDRFSYKICDSIEEVLEFFGHKWLAKELYSDAGIEDVVDIE